MYLPLSFKSRRFPRDKESLYEISSKKNYQFSRIFHRFLHFTRSDIRTRDRAIFHGADPNYCGLNSTATDSRRSSVQVYLAVITHDRTVLISSKFEILGIIQSVESGSLNIDRTIRSFTWRSSLYYKQFEPLPER